MELTPEEVFSFHKNQLYEIATVTQARQNRAWAEPIAMAVREMESGLMAKLAPKRKAMGVARSATLWRQREVEGTDAWFIACIIESLATCRLLRLRHPDRILDVEYNFAYMMATTVGRAGISGTASHP